MTRRLSRRTLLRGTGAALSLPILEVMLDGCGRLPAGQEESLGRRSDAETVNPETLLVTLFFPHGAPMESWTPAAEGLGWAPTPCLTPLAPLQGQLSVLTGLTNTAALSLASEGGPHSRGAASWATGLPTGKFGATGPSVEQVAAAQLGGQARFRVLTVSAQQRPSSGAEGGSSALLHHLSWEGAGRPAEAFRQPRTLFHALFGAPEDASRASLLDRVRSEAEALDRKLGTEDRRRLDGYLTAVRELERIVTSPPAACAPPTGLEAGLTTPLPTPEHRRLMGRLFVLGLRCGQARFASFALTDAIDDAPPTWLGLNASHHALTHQADRPQLVRMTQDQIGAVADLLGEMQAEREADGRTLLDRAMVFVSSEVSDPYDHRYDDLPVLLAGRGGGLVPGSHVRYPPGTSLSRLYLALLHRVGVNRETFGLDGTTPLPLPG